MKYLSINEVMSKFSVSRSTIDKWRRADFPKAYTLEERKLFFLESEVDAWAKKKMRKAA